MSVKKDTPKLDAAIDKILDSPEATDILMAKMLERDLHVMKGLSYMGIKDPERREGARTAIVLDTETTGLNPEENKVIQLAMIKVLYDDEGIVEVTDDLFDQMEDPGAPLDPKITRLTGITDEQLRGKRIDKASISDFIKGADLIIAHNASFDRQFVEKAFKGCGFEDINWACSIRDVDWESRIAGSIKLELLNLDRGYVYPAHNAQADIRATSFILNQKFGQPTTVMQDIIESLERRHVMVMATGLNYWANEALKKVAHEPLKKAGFKWSVGREGEAGEKCWWQIVSTPQEANDAARALREAFGGDVMLPIRRFTPLNSYSSRLPPLIRNGFETKNPLKAIGAEDLVADRDEPGPGVFGF